MSRGSEPAVPQGEGTLHLSLSNSPCGPGAESFTGIQHSWLQARRKRWEEKGLSYGEFVFVVHLPQHTANRDGLSGGNEEVGSESATDRTAGLLAGDFEEGGVELAALLFVEDLENTLAAVFFGELDLAQQIGFLHDAIIQDAL